MKSCLIKHCSKTSGRTSCCQRARYESVCAFQSHKLTDVALVSRTKRRQSRPKDCRTRVMAAHGTGTQTRRRWMGLECTKMGTRLPGAHSKSECCALDANPTQRETPISLYRAVCLLHDVANTCFSLGKMGDIGSRPTVFLARVLHLCRCVDSCLRLPQFGTDTEVVHHRPMRLCGLHARFELMLLRFV